MAREEILFYLVTTASFVESATDTYTHNLVEYYAGDPEIASWLQNHWQAEELQHGRALKRYVQLTWPFFDWDRVYAGFFHEFSAKAASDGLESDRCLEAVSRCIVEMGTSGYYTAIAGLSPDPVLSMLAGLIREDEIRHYKYFYRFFSIYRRREGTSRVRVLRAILRRLKMLDFEDSTIALKHAYAIQHPGVRFDRRRYREVQKQIREALSADFPVQMSAKMTLKPLDLNYYVQKAVLFAIEVVSHRLFPHRPPA
ncbi:MAG TPA: acyl-ACP desaturase [Gammaproteobacteria bacterium]|jgi:hypothetical protein